MAAKVDKKFEKVEKILAKRRVRLKDRTSSVLYLVRWENQGPNSDTWEKKDQLIKYARDKLNDFSQWAVKNGLVNQYNIARYEAKSSAKLNPSLVALQQQGKQYIKFFYNNHPQLKKGDEKSVKPKNNVLEKKRKLARCNQLALTKKPKTTADSKQSLVNLHGRPVSKKAKSYHSFSIRSNRIQAITHQNRRSTSDNVLSIRRPLLLSDSNCAKRQGSKPQLFSSKRRRSSSSSGSDSETLYSLQATESHKSENTAVLNGNNKSHPTYIFKKASGLSMNCNKPAVHPSSVSTPESDDPEISFKVPAASTRSGSCSFTTSTPPQSEENAPCSSIAAPLSPDLNFDTLEKDLRNLPTDQMLRRLRKRNPGTDDEESLLERRTSVRQLQSAYRYKNIVVKKCQMYTQIWLFTQTRMKNVINPEVSAELLQALQNASQDDSRVVMVTGSGSIFCSGVDLHYLLHSGPDAAQTMAKSLKELVMALISFPKPLIAVVNGAAMGLGMTLLPLCDIVYASDKATFCCPYMHLAQTPEGAASFSFPNVMGFAMANEVLLAGRCLTAMEACQVGLVSRVFWPTSLMPEAIPRIERMAQSSGRAMEGSKLLIRSQTSQKLKAACEGECRVLVDVWTNKDCKKAIASYLRKENLFP